MRQVIAKVPEGQGRRVLDIGQQHSGRNMASVKASDRKGAWEMVYIFIDNHAVGPLINDLEEIHDAQITLIPHGTIPMSPPPSQVQQQISSVTRRSPMEIWLNGLMSIGSWTGFLGYTVAASLVVWIGLFTNSSIFLVASMLIAPFAGPAMNTAIATATGDPKLLWRNLLRYFSSLALTVAITYLASLIYGQQVATSIMISVSEVSAVAVLLPLVAGAAGALHLINSSNNSLVPGAAVGVLVAAALAPPAGLAGMAAAVGRWDLAANGAFLLLLQLVGINLSGSLVFRFYGGLKPSGPRYNHGQSRYVYISFIATVLALGGLLFWQFSSGPNLQRSTQAQNAVEVVNQVVKDSGYAGLVEANMRFTRSSISGQNTLLGDIYVQRMPAATIPDEQIKQRLTQKIQAAILQKGFNVTPLMNVTVLDPP